MASVSAVVSKQQIDTISSKLRAYGQQYQDVWDLGIQLALRISDLLNIRYEDIRHNRLRIVEAKTQKVVNVLLNEKSLQIISRRRNDFPKDVYLFQSHHKNVSGTKPLTRIAVYKTFRVVGDDIGISLGTHSMRKTRGYFVYREFGIGETMRMLNHSKEAVTLRYIGITQQRMDEVSSMEL
ncbi:tyrosine-type recombinase/integrase [Aliivibrio sp. S4TY2]|uniref:tyrosine-type recombinase/integrase n=1 Tax=unclassified Aliivibrio TaxID=2645654 RepID=UPI002379DFF4|nr:MULTISPECIES: tyrosine-type recombinase/integrase [unclassified Aliivibrio]MDD9156413.1 tyrosine-type recombinase/integrase [Aliivibrio sp. S4TY2]MDD9162343.1 tyrosine-type recombinase/integrase [Aliivibrio sp. S4TY1]MDD9164121.1 tyrosine-type recombinase/integrase [Aliivibrio sp. S4MY2]MDD9167906.1 tyrosine-type recombinase/integrase [Aliivibrio sp. S4MY4]MDD9187429.1 tyrosine-type recombinase/integrase [Aliivibrio sp. S4MY3]